MRATMTNPQKAKGDAAEREIAALLEQLLGYRVRRKLGAGRADDTGDLDGIPNTVAQVKNYRDLARGLREGLDGLATQQTNAAATHAVLFLRRPGGRWIAAMPVESWATLHREATT